MKRFSVFLCSLVLVLGLAGGANAITLVDTTVFTETGTDSSEDYIDSGGDFVNKLEGAFDFVTWAHSFVFDPSVDQILDATLEISFVDDENDRIFKISTWESAAVIGDDWWNFLGGVILDVDTGEELFDVDVDVLYDGRYVVWVGSAGDFSIISSTLTIEYTADSGNGTAPVPEPATMLLLGTGLMGLAAAKRKRMLNKK